MARTLDELLEPIRARRAAREAESMAPVQSRGLLAGLGRVLDFPGRKVREFVTGRPEATGRDFLQQLGLAGPNQRGFDAGDVASFGAEVLLDPLTYLGGIGTLTKTGKAAKAIGKVGDDIGAVADAVLYATKPIEKARAQSMLDDLLSRRQVLLSEQAAAGAPATLAKGWRAQGEAGQRSLLKLGIPFTGIEANVVRGAPVLGALGKAGGALRATAPVRGLERLFNPNFGRLPETAATYEQFLGRGLREGLSDTLDTGRNVLRAQGEILAQTPDLAEKEVFDRLVKGVEGTGQIGEKEILAREAAEALPGGKALIKELTGEFAERNRREILSGSKAGARAFTDRPGAALQQLLDRKLGRFTEEALPEGVPQGGQGAIYARGQNLPPPDRFGTQRVAPDVIGREGGPVGRELFSRERSGVLPDEPYRSQASKMAKVEGEFTEAPPGFLPGNVLSSKSKSYFPRVPTPEYKKALAEEGKLQGLLRPRQTTTKAGFQKSREEALLEAFTPDVNEILKGTGKDFDAFQTNPALAVAERGARSEVSIAAAKLVTSLSDNFSRVGGAADDVPLSKFIAAGPLRQYKGVPLPDDELGIQRVLEAAGLGDRAIPKPVYDEFVGVVEKLSAPEEVMGLFRAFDEATAFYRTAFTVPFPAFHIRNFFSDTVMSWLNGGANPLKLAEAFQKARDPQWLREAENLGILKGSGTRWILDQAGKGGGLKGPGAARQVAQFGENFSRTWHFLSKKAQGLSDIEAAASVKKALFDYSELTPTEQIIAKRLVLFYNWPRKVVPAILAQYIENPAKMAALTRGATNPSVERPDALPGFVQRGAAIPLGPTPEGGYSVLSGLGLPIEELGKLDPTSPEGGLLGALKQFMRRGGEMANPLLAAPAELALGRDFRTGRNLLEQDRADPLLGMIPGLSQLVGYKEEVLPSGDIRPRGDPLTLWALGRSPAARGLSTLAQGQELSQGGEDASLLRLLTGAQRFDLNKGDMLRAQEDALKARAKGLQRTGEVRTREILFAAGPEGKKSPEAEALVRRLREVEKARKKEAVRAAAPR